MFDRNETERTLSSEQLVKENRNLKRQLRNLESTFQRNKAMLAARTTVNHMLEHEQKKMERNMNLLLENSADIILLFDKDNKFSYFTKTFLKTTGLTDSSLVGGKSFSAVFSQLVSAEWISFMQTNISLAMEKRSTITVNSSIDLSGGDHPQEYDIQITPMMDWDGHLEAFMILLHDITDIMASKRQAESANIAKSQFLATMSHEMRTPMNAVLGMTSIGQVSTDMEKMIGCFAKIEDAAKHLLGVINDILDMSKIEAGKLELSPKIFAFETMLERIVNMVNAQAAEKGQSFSVHIDKAIPCCLIGDDQRLAQIITNLLGNAVKFTPDGGSIGLDAHLLEEKNGICEIRVTVSDTGIGISPEQQARLFQSFHQAESDTARKFGGTGLGLSISKNIVEIMGGNIKVNSELGKGSSFLFTVPLKRASDRGAAPDAVISWGDVRIMAVDADPLVLRFFDEVAQRLCVHCDTASSGGEALSLREKNGDYHLYFVDSQIPGTDGNPLTRALIAGNTDSDDVVVMLPSADRGMSRAEADHAGVNRFLFKPLFPSVVADTVAEVLSARGLVEAEQNDKQLSFAGKCILLADDVAINREIVLALLESTCLQIECAENGAEAVHMFSEAPDRYSLIFMDIQMPGMDGYEATRLIRESCQTRSKDIPIIAMTANVFREDIERCIKAGMNDHIGKPLSFDKIIQQLKLHL